MIKYEILLLDSSDLAKNYPDGQPLDAEHLIPYFSDGICEEIVHASMVIYMESFDRMVVLKNRYGLSGTYVRE
jgi:hypothetical protein